MKNLKAINSFIIFLGYLIGSFTLLSSCSTYRNSDAERAKLYNDYRQDTTICSLPLLEFEQPFSATIDTIISSYERCEFCKDGIKPFVFLVNEIYADNSLLYEVEAIVNTVLINALMTKGNIWGGFIYNDYVFVVTKSIVEKSSFAYKADKTFVEYPFCNRIDFDKCGFAVNYKFTDNNGSIDIKCYEFEMTTIR